MSRKMAVALMAVSMVFSISVASQAHGSVDGFFTLPRRTGTNTLVVDTGASSSDQHNSIKNVVTFQRKSGSSWIKFHDYLAGDCCNTTGFTDTAFTACNGTATGTATYRTKWETWWYNDAGGVAHHKGPSFSNGVSISNTTCYND